MAKGTKSKSTFPTNVSDLTVDQLMTLIDRKIAGGEVPWPMDVGLTPNPYPPYPWPGPIPPWPPYPCPPIYNTRTAAISDAMPGAMPSQSKSLYKMQMLATAPRQTVSEAKIQDELIDALVSWKPRFAGITKKKKLKDMAASGDGRFDVISAVDLWPFFQSLGLNLHYFHIGSDETLEEAAETIGKLLENIGHVVTS